jgi:heat shock protein HtpX
MNGVNQLVRLQHARRNLIHSLLLLLFMIAFLMLLGWLVWGRDGMLLLATVGLVAVLFNPTIPPQMIMKLYGARPIHLNEAPVLWNTLSWLSDRSGLDNCPELYYIPSSVLNAFSVGKRDRAIIAVTDGLLRKLELNEVAAVLAHEVSHIRSNDLWVMGVADMISRVTNIMSLFGQFLFIVNLPLILFTAVSVNVFAIILLVIAPGLSALAQLALSRTREFDADLNAAHLIGDPNSLARALMKIDALQRGWLEQLLLPGRGIPDPSLLRSHPHTAERIKRLIELSPRMTRSERQDFTASAERYDESFGKPISRSPGWHINGLWH